MEPLGTNTLPICRRDAAEERHFRARIRELHAEHVHREAADQGERHAGEQVLHGDDLVVGRPQVLHEPVLGVLVVRGGVGLGVSVGVNAHRRSPAGL
jgi:hypothetical protein